MLYWSTGGVQTVPSWQMTGSVFFTFSLAGVDVGDGIALAPHVLDEEGLAVVGPAFVDPHVRAVARGDAVAEPLMRALVHDDEVEPCADAGLGAAKVAVLEVVAVGDRGLVLDAGVQGFDELVAVAVEGILAEVVLVGLQHVLHLDELVLRLVEVFGEDEVVERERAVLVGVGVVEVDVGADVQRDIVVVDGIADVPVPARVAVAEIGLLLKAAVGYLDEIAGRLDADVHGVGLHRATDLCWATRRWRLLLRRQCLTRGRPIGSLRKTKPPKRPISTGWPE